MKKIIVLVSLVLATSGCVKDDSGGNSTPRETIVFSPAGGLTPELLDKLTKNHKVGDNLTIVELGENGPRKVGTRVKVARWTAKEAQKAGSDLREIGEFLRKKPADSEESPRLSMPAIFRAASEIRKFDTPLDVVVLAAPIHTQKAAFDCSGGRWISDGCITQPGTPFSQTYENLHDTTFWFIPKGWQWGENDTQEQAWIRATQLLAAKNNAKLGQVSPDSGAVLKSLQDGEIKLADAVLSDDEKVCLYEAPKWEVKADAENTQSQFVSVDPYTGEIRPVAPVLPNWVQQAFQAAQDAGRSVVGVCWRTPSMENEPIDIDLYAVNRDGESVFFAEPTKAFGRLSRDVRASNSGQSNQINEETWEVIEVDGPLADYEWCVNHYSGSGPTNLKMTLIHRAAASNKDQIVNFDWKPGRPDGATGFESRNSSASWRPLPELR